MAQWANDVESCYDNDRDCGTPAAANGLTVLCKGFAIWATLTKSWADGIEACYQKCAGANVARDHNPPPSSPFTI